MSRMSQDARRLRDALAGVVEAYRSRFATPAGRLCGPIDEPVEQAERLLALLQENRQLPSRCSSEEFDNLIANVRFGTPMQSALRDILVHGRTWKQAASTAGVSQSGILRALRRLNRLAPVPQPTEANR